MRPASASAYIHLCRVIEPGQRLPLYSWPTNRIHILQRALVFILTALMAAQSLGLSYTVLPAMNTSGQTMSCHEHPPAPTISAVAGSDATDCCGPTDCGCCWGCAGLLNVQLNLSAHYPSIIYLLARPAQPIVSPTQSPYRPPIFA